MNIRLDAARLILSAALTAAVLLQSCVRDVAGPAEEPAEWTDVPIPPVVSLDAYAIASDGRGTLYLGADSEASLWRSTDGGLTWTEKTLGLNTASFNVTALLAKSGGPVFAALWGGGVFVSRDRGDHWTQVNNHLTDIDVRSLAAAADGAIIAGTSNGRIFRSSDDGGVWVETKGDSIEGEVNVLLADSIGTIYAASRWQGVFFSADSGRTWAPSSSGLDNSYIQCMTIHDGGYVLVGTSWGRVYRSAGRGAPWVRIDGGAIPWSVDALATDRTGCIYAGTSGHGVIRSRDGGASWERTDIGLQGLDVRSLLRANGFLLAGTFNNGVFRSTDGGDSWKTPRDYFPNDPLLYKWYWSDNYLSIDSCGTYYLRTRGSIHRSRDGGETWVRACYGINRPINGFAIHPNSWLLAGANDGIYISTDSGDTWSRADTSLSGRLAVYALEAAPNGAVFGRTDKGVLKFAEDGSSWECVFDETEVAALSTGAAGCVYIGTDYSGVFGSSDYGETWRRMTDSLDVYSIEADLAGNVFAASNEGVLCSGDGGTSWKTMQPGGNYYWYSVAAAPDGKAAIIFDDDGALYISEDCFSSWNAVPVPFVDSDIFLGPDGRLFISHRRPPGLHRSINAMF